MNKIKILVGLMSLVAIMSACNKESESYSFDKVKNSKFEHLHGLGYINGGPEIVISTHDGLYEYGEGGWKEANSEKHDYMGFQAIREGFFSSGHPEPGSNYKNPLGLVKSTEKGASFDQLAFYGEIDFHYLAAGYESKVIYVLNEIPTKGMSTGLHYSTDEGTTWKESSMKEFNSEFISNLAAHPTRKEMIAIGSKEGLFLSEDYGEKFSLFNEAKMVTYVTLTDAGGFYANLENEKVMLTSFALDSDQEIEIQLPNNQQIEPIAFIAVNPNNPKEIVIATHNNDIYLTKDEGLNWKTLAESGELAK
ncbi:F510_1955 family glycosylhydrolase [Sporosarcina sp. E16_8]|uniref:F510_1955 family glycosylhydrolase n=1 Tax=Sporosarcina sp. E16_8 TaxID=2789295 RepID=UPI001A925BAD|nr:sialidase [Sporosarcina sp. E16_8]MBO0587722.1 sialidase [Sporosarcina sp. E16_8]